MNTKKIASIALIWLPSAMLIMSAGAKFAGAQQVVDGLTKIGFLPGFPLPLLAVLELVCVGLFLFPKTFRVGFFLVCGYLGGAGAIEIASHQPPAALILLTIVWMGVYLKDATLFTGGTAAK